MHQFSIKDIENLTGIKAHTLRIWEQRHNLCIPKRKESKHRFYDNEDLKHILRISYLYHGGIRVSRIASMQEEEIRQMALRPLAENDMSPYANQMIEASLDLDEIRFEKVIDTALLHLGFERCVLHVIYPYLEKMGVLWLGNQAIPAQEHFSSQIILRKMIYAIDGIEKATRANARRILLFAPEGEHHEIPLLFTHYLLKRNQDDVVYLGKNVNLASIRAYCELYNISHLMINLITNVTGWYLPEYLQHLSALFPDQKIVGAGPAFQHFDGTVPNGEVLRSLDALIAYANLKD
jgi:MerR family transcriptional regulator, light-induced transcriptional regulator